MMWEDDDDFPSWEDFHSHDPYEFTLRFERVKRETAQAWLIEFGINGDTLESIEAWLPKSQCRINLSALEIEVPEWLVIEKELEDYEA